MEPKHRTVRRKILFAALLLIMGWATVGVGLNPEDFLDIGKTFQFMLRFFPPDTSVLKEAIEQSVVTLQIALTGTFYALVVAFPCSFLLARNTGPKGLSGILRSIFSFVRSVPEIVWGLLFVVTVGLGPVAGVIAIFLHNIGVLGKLISELVEASDKETQEAIIAVGGNKVHTIGFAIVPEILPNVLSQYFYRLEVGIRTSLILGVIGAGGIGNMLFIDFKVFEYPAVLTEIIVIMILVLLIDAVGAWVRKKVM